MMIFFMTKNYFQLDIFMALWSFVVSVLCPVKNGLDKFFFLTICYNTNVLVLLFFWLYYCYWYAWFQLNYYILWCKEIFCLFLNLPFKWDVWQNTSKATRKPIYQRERSQHIMFLQMMTELVVRVLLLQASECCFWLQQVGNEKFNGIWIRNYSIFF